jgi:hypothetical protein
MRNSQKHYLLRTRECAVNQFNRFPSLLPNRQIANLRVADVRTELARPHIRIRNGAS